MTVQLTVSINPADTVALQCLSVANTLQSAVSFAASQGVGDVQGALVLGQLETALGTHVQLFNSMISTAPPAPNVLGIYTGVFAACNNVLAALGQATVPFTTSLSTFNSMVSALNAVIAGNALPDDDVDVAHELTMLQGAWAAFQAAPAAAQVAVPVVGDENALGALATRALNLAKFLNST